MPVAKSKSGFVAAWKQHAAEFLRVNLEVWHDNAVCNEYRDIFDKQCDLIHRTADIMELEGVWADDKKLYDVLNDYSMTRANRYFDKTLYRKVEGALGNTYIHKEFDEIHYFETELNVEGKFYHAVINGGY